VFVAGRRRGLGIGLLAAGIVLLSACSSSGSTPRTLPRLSTTPAAATSAAPPTSKAAELAAVKAVVRRYYALLNAPTTVANANALAALMTKDCTCRRVARSIRRLATAHRSYFGHSTVVTLRPSIDSQSNADVYVQYDYTRGGYRDDGGHILHIEPGHVGVKVDFRLVGNGSGWLIAQVDLITSGSK